MLDATRRQEGRAASGTVLQSEATLKTKVQRQLLKTAPLLYDSMLISQFPKHEERQINYLFLIEHTITFMFPQTSLYNKMAQVLLVWAMYISALSSLTFWVSPLKTILLNKPYQSAPVSSTTNYHHQLLSKHSTAKPFIVVNKTCVSPTWSYRAWDSSNLRRCATTTWFA